MQFLKKSKGLTVLNIFNIKCAKDVRITSKIKVVRVVLKWTHHCVKNGPLCLKGKDLTLYFDLSHF